MLRLNMAKCGFWNAHLFLCQCGDKLRLLCLEIRAKAGWRGHGTCLTMICAPPLRKLKYLLQERLRARSSASAPLSLNQLDNVYEHL